MQDTVREGRGIPPSADRARRPLPPPTTSTLGRPHLLHRRRSGCAYDTAQLQTRPGGAAHAGAPGLGDDLGAAWARCSPGAAEARVHDHLQDSAPEAADALAPLGGHPTGAT